MSSAQVIERPARGGERRVAVERELILTSRLAPIAAIFGDPSELEVRDGKRRTHLDGIAKRALGAAGVARRAGDEPLGQRAVERRRVQAPALGDAREGSIELSSIGEGARGVEIQDRFARAPRYGGVEFGDGRR